MVSQFFDGLVEALGTTQALSLAGLVVGILFGFMAQRSRFCLRSAVIEFVTGHFGEKLAIWLLTFGIAITATQFLITEGLLDVSSSRSLAARGSLSGAIVGGVLFGTGMVLARGCASRLLVLSATGNLRALVSGLIFVVVAQASYQGLFAPFRVAISELWTLEGGHSRDLMLRLGGQESDKLPIALLWLVSAYLFAIKGRVSLWGWVGGVGTGASIALAYFLTYQIGLAAIEPGTARGVTFSGPSAEVLMRILSPSTGPMGFDSMLIPGVFAGSALAALVHGEWHLSVFDTQSGTVRYLVGAALMGFGAIMAGGCAVGAGVSGGAIFALTAWLALLGMWIGAGATHWVVDERRQSLTIAPGEMQETGAG